MYRVLNATLLFKAKDENGRLLHDDQLFHNKIDDGILNV